MLLIPPLPIFLKQYKGLKPASATSFNSSSKGRVASIVRPAAFASSAAFAVAKKAHVSISSSMVSVVAPPLGRNRRQTARSVISAAATTERASSLPPASAGTGGNNGRVMIIGERRIFLSFLLESEARERERAQSEKRELERAPAITNDTPGRAGLFSPSLSPSLSRSLSLSLSRSLSLSLSLSLSQLTTLCVHLDRMWTEGQGHVILYTWYQFITSDVLATLGINRELRLDYEDPTHRHLTWDMRAVQDVTRPCLVVEKILAHDRREKEREFADTHFVCDVCFCSVLGSKCGQHQPCGHTHCHECLRSYLNMKIGSGDVTQLECPSNGCTTIVNPLTVKSLVSDALFNRCVSHHFVNFFFVFVRNKAVHLLPCKGAHVYV